MSFRALGRAAIAAVAVAAVAMGASAATVDFPGPLEGPGRPSLKKSETKRLTKAWNKLEAGDLTAASKLLRKVRGNPAGELLGLQIRMVSDDEPPVDSLVALCSNNRDYAAAWATLTAAKVRVGDEMGALEAADRVAVLWPDSPWAATAAELREQWVEDRLAAALDALNDGNPDRTLELLEQTNALDPENREALILEALALIDLDRQEEATEILLGMPDNPDVWFLLAQLAEQRGDLFAAMQYYTQLPADTPGRAEGLQRVKLAWRIKNLPSYVQDALASEEVNRAELALILVGLVPEAHAVGGGQVPVLPDIVDLPSQREILTAVRLDLMEVDEIQRQFDPDRPVTADESRAAIDGLCKLLNLDLPIWCTETDEHDATCVMLDTPIRGQEVAEIILQATHGEGP
jgi:tetratricopeptide (TPR) repeat protein